LLRFNARLVVFSLLGGIALSACQVADSETVFAEAVPEAERYGGTVVVGSFGDLQTMNALVSTDYQSGMIQRDMLFMPLIRYNERLEPQPWLAERWDTVRVSPDSIDLTFYLRQDIRWHDGEPTTAEDVAFTFERAVDPRTAFPNAANWALYRPTADVIDSHTVRFRLRPHADFLDMWYQTPAMPKHLLADVPPEQLISHSFGPMNPVGNGPFRHVRRTPGQEWVFEANPDYPEGLGGRPYLDRMVYREIPDHTALLTEVLTGRVDVSGIRPEQLDRIRARRTFA
jgi:peptide/nickel transport system substrate-binding protein